MAISISKGNIKLGGIANFNITPGRTCSKSACNTCLVDGCYAMKSYRMYPSVRKAWDTNTDLVENDLQLVRAELIMYMVKKQPEYFRIHSAGDFFTLDYLKVWVEIAKMFPKTRFMAYTKQFDILRQLDEYVPDNLVIYLSSWHGLSDFPVDMIDKYPVAWLADTADGADFLSEKTGAHICTGDCTLCTWCYNNHSDVIFIKH